MNKELIILRINEFGVLLKFMICKFVSYFLPKSDVWLISERGHEARDNAFVFFCYLRKEHPEINACFIISSDSKDVVRFSEPNRLIEFGSIFHYMILCRAPYLISTHIMGYTPWMDFFSTLDGRYNIFKKQRKIFLQHGIIKDSLPQLFGNNINVDLFICGAKKEHEYVSSTFGHKNGVVQYTGLCRYDNLVSFDCKKQILIMPTWRLYLDDTNFLDSSFYKSFSQLLVDDRFHEILNKYEYTVVFYPHYEIQKRIEYFFKLTIPQCIKIADMNYDVQTLLKESACLITDYSSVFFDMMYMGKPLLFFQFDAEQYREQHYKEGYFSYSDAGIIETSINGLLEQLDYILASNCKPTQKYCDYANSTFMFRDDKNCERVFNTIQHL